MRLREHDLVLKEIDGETVLLDLVSSTYFSANRTGTFLLGLLGEEQETEALVAALAQEFGLDGQAARVDTDAFVALLAEQRLLA